MIDTHRIQYAMRLDVRDLTSSRQLPAGTYLTPDAMLLYCKQRTARMDAQIDAAFARQNAANAVSKAVSDLTTVLGQHASIPEGPAGAAARQAITDAYAATVAALPPGSDARTQIEAEQAKWLATGGPAVTGVRTSVSTDEMKDFNNTLANVQKSLNGGAELEMMQLQSLMSQRSTFLQFISSQLQSLDQTAKAIIGR